MALIDANVILRFILRDHEEMHRQPEQMIATGKFDKKVQKLIQRGKPDETL